MRRSWLFITALVLLIALAVSACSAGSGNDANANMAENTAYNSSSGGGNGFGRGNGSVGGSGSGGGNGSGGNTDNAAEEVEEPINVAEAALKITGSVATEMAWAEDEVRAMDTIDAVSTNKEREESTYTGVPIITLLGLAQVNADATKVVFVADDGYTAEVTLEELNACADCIVSFRSNGGFSTVLPGFAGSLQVKGVIEIQVQ